MLALADDAALARLVIGATSIPRRARSSWLRDIAAKLDSPSECGLRENPRSDAARRQVKARALRKNGIHIYRLPLRDICVEGLITQMVTTGRLTEAEALHHAKRGYLVVIRLGDVVGVCSAGEITNVTHAFHPSGRFWLANSQ